jgi:hypothetical protein
VDHDADYRRGIRIRGIWPEDELNDSNRRILAGGGDGVTRRVTSCAKEMREMLRMSASKRDSLFIRFGSVAIV